MSTRRYIRIDDQTNWSEDIVLVQIFPYPEGELFRALVRSAFLDRAIVARSVEDAFAKAQRIRFNYGLKAVGVHLHEDVRWEEAWGVLVDVEDISHQARHGPAG